MAKLAMVRVSGTTPDYGAIFIANRHTRHECFQRKLFGAPFSCLPFVKQIKAGMVLFLFEYEAKKLYGVFEATTDGGLNIIPEAYQQVEQSYPSQVRFIVLWRCKPLSELEFRGAIKDNYYAPYKFNFGLSKDQVQKLVSLFYSKKIIVLRSLTPKIGKRKRSNSLDAEDHWGICDKPKLEEGEIENSVSQTTSQSVAASEGSCFSGTLVLSTKNVKMGSENKIVPSDTTSADLEDYIPLPPPEQDDLSETEKAFPEAITRKKTDYEDLYLLRECIIPKVFGPKDSNQGGVSNGCYKSTLVSKRENKSIVKGLYADNLEDKKCVFSRLNLVITPPAAEEIKDNMQSPDGLMKKLQQSHKTWKKSTMKNKEQKEDKAAMRNRASAFSRLTLAPNKAVEKKCNMNIRDEHISRNTEIVTPNNKKRQSVFLRLQNESQAKKPLGCVFAKQPNDQIPSQESSAGKELGKIHEEGSTKSEITNADHNGVSQKEVVTRNEEVCDLTPKTLLTYFRRRRRRLSASPVVKETKLSVGADEGEACGGEVARNGTLASEKVVCV